MRAVVVFTSGREATDVRAVEQGDGLREERGDDASDTDGASEEVSEAVRVRKFDGAAILVYRY